MKIFLISPVRNAESEIQERIAEYVASLEADGHQVHWPIRDTRQDDPTGGYEICRANFTGILEADDVHIWYDETSNGSKFDMGGVFMLVAMLGREKKVVIVNDVEIVDDKKRVFIKFSSALSKRQNNNLVPGSLGTVL
ncbi:hypothetical protein HYT01_03910 [Candidatus Giovannonibacteria bacterium]|nr:hypothetical protein [Candidatus Giovannonibacteria bacterium]